MADDDDNATSGFLTDAELLVLLASPTSDSDLLVRALDELVIRRRIGAARRAALDAASAFDAFDHSDRTTKQFEPLLGYCVCEHCQKLPAQAERA